MDKTSCEWNWVLVTKLWESDTESRENEIAMQLNKLHEMLDDNLPLTRTQC